MDLSPGLSYLLGQLSRALLSPGSHVSLTSLLCALSIAVFVVAARRRRKGRRIRVKPLLRALFPRTILRSESNRVDVFYFFFNIFIFGIVFGWALLSYEVLSHSVADVLTASFGPRQPSALPTFVSRSIITVMLFLAYELGYWLNHYLSHRIPFLWEFHKGAPHRDGSHPAD